MFLNSLSSTNLETKYLSPVKPAGKFAIQPSWKWLCSLYHICIFHLQWQLNVFFMVNISYPLYLQASMSNSSFLLFPLFLLCRCTLYHLLLKSFILGLKAFFFNHCSLYLTLFDLYTSVIFTRYHRQAKTWSGTRCLFGWTIFQGHFAKFNPPPFWEPNILYQPC